MREAASRGFFLGSKAPFGYRKIKVSDGRGASSDADSCEFIALSYYRTCVSSHPAGRR